MRFRLILEIDKRAYGNVMPINYQYEQSAVIYRILSSGNEQFSAWLHDNGFNSYYKKSFKLFCYSPFIIEYGGWRIIKKEDPMVNRLMILADTIEWQISFFPERSMEEFIKGVFTDQTFCIGDDDSRVQMHIRSVEQMPEPEFKETMEYDTISPLFIKLRKEDESDEYISLEHPASEGLLKGSLFDKYRAFYGKPYPDADCQVKFNLSSKPIKKLRTIKGIGLAGYMSQLRITAPIELQRIIYYAGLGGECSQGFGCLRVISNR